MPVITISRGTFSGGTTLGECLAAKLGYRVLSREVLVEAAREFGISIDKLTSAMEKPPAFWEEAGGERSGYLSYVRAVLAERALEGDLVYHGHAGHLLLRGISHVVRVRVIADMEYRINSAMDHMHLSRKEAANYIKKVDKERAQWTRFLYGVEWNDPTGYDVTINLQNLTIDDACDILGHMARMPAFQPTKESMKALQDLALGTRVWAELARDPVTGSAKINVAADGGFVVVEGTTGSQKVIDAIPRVARRVSGVRDVDCRVGIGADWIW